MTGDDRSVEYYSSRAKQIRKTYAPPRNGAAAVAPGFVLSVEYSVKGAVKYIDFKKESSPISIGTKQVPGEVLSSTRVISEPDAYEQAQKLVSEAVIITDRQTAPYINGLKFVDNETMKNMERELAPIREKAQDLNEALIAKNSNMRVKIDFYKFLVDTTDRRNAIRLAQLIHERLTQLKAMYENKRINAFRTYMDNVTNLERVVTGQQRDLIENAIRATVRQRPIMIANYGGKKHTAALRAENGGDIPPFDYTAIDAAIEVFASSIKYS